MTSISSTSSGAAALQQLLAQQRTQRFQAADKDGSGGLSLAEFIGGMPQQASNNISASQAQQMFSNMDSDGDGSVTQAEMDAAWKQHSAGPLSSSNLLQAQQGSGDTAQDAIKSLLDAMQNSDSSSTTTASSSYTDPRDAFTQKLFQSLDGNGDGSVTKSEVEDAVTKAGGSKNAADALYAQLDPNNTGSVNQQQLAQNLPPPPGPPPGGPPPGGGGHSASSSDSSGQSALQALLDALSSSNTDGTSSTTASSTGSSVDNLFKLFDSDSSGSISQTDLSAGFAQIRNQMMSSLLSAQEQSSSIAS